MDLVLQQLEIDSAKQQKASLITRKAIQDLQHVKQLAMWTAKIAKLEADLLEAKNAAND